MQRKERNLTSNRARRRIDVASSILVAIGLISAAAAYALIEYMSFNSLIIVPAIVSTVLGLTRITYIEAPRQMF